MPEARADFKALASPVGGLPVSLHDNPVDDPSSTRAAGVSAASSPVDRPSWPKRGGTICESATRAPFETSARASLLGARANGPSGP